MHPVLSPRPGSGSSSPPSGLRLADVGPLEPGALQGPGFLLVHLDVVHLVLVDQQRLLVDKPSHYIRFRKTSNARSNVADQLLS